jgi:hypothetical protein
MSATMVLLVAAALASTGLLTAVWRPDVTGAIAGIPLLAAGLGLAGAGVSRYATASGPATAGQELAVAAVVGGFALVALVTALAGGTVRPVDEEERRRAAAATKKGARKGERVGGKRR